MLWRCINKLPAFSNLNISNKIHARTSSRYDAISEFEGFEYLGGGSFGKVYKIKHKQSQEHYVLKEILVNEANLKETHVSECLEEATFLMDNQHPNIIGDC
jgi:hypothetical protein